MKKIILILIIITLLLSLTACGKNDGNFPKDDGKRYANVVDAMYGEDNSIEREILYTIEMGNYVSYGVSTNGGIRSGITYRDKMGYFDFKGIRNNQTNKQVEQYSVTIDWIAKKNIIFVHFLSENKNYDIHLISDNINSDFDMGVDESSSVYAYGYMAVLDEIPEDYAIIIDGVSYKISDYMSLGTKTIIMFSVLFTGIGAFVLMLIIRKIKRKKRKELAKKLFK